VGQFTVSTQSHVKLANFTKMITQSLYHRCTVLYLSKLFRWWPNRLFLGDLRHQKVHSRYSYLR